MLQMQGKTRWTTVSYDVDVGIGTMAQIGFLVFDCDQTLSHEAHAMLNVPGIALFKSRLSSAAGAGKPLSIELLQDGFGEIESALGS